jgi:adenylate cyclase
MRRIPPTLIFVAVAGVVFGVVYRYFLDDPSEASLAFYLRSAAHGLLVAVFGWGANLYINSRASRWLRTWPILAEIALRAVMLAVAIAIVIAVLERAIYDRPLSTQWLQGDFPRIIVMALVLSILFGSVFELMRLIGGRVLLNVVLGRYRHPTREDRVMMFLDLAGSTSLAEALGEVRMQELLTRFFFDIDEPIVAHGGEVHAYVGDEVIVSWPLSARVSGGACLDCYFAIRDRIDERAESYQDRFGSVPRFRLS